MANFNVGIITQDYKSQTLTLPGSSVGGNPEYPSTWFVTNPKRKPKVLIPSPTMSPTEISKLLGYALANTITPGLVLYYFHEYITSNVTYLNTSRWESYETLKAESNELISPIHLLEVIKGPPPSDNTQGESIDASGRKRLFYMLLAGYRYGLASEIAQGDYKATVLGKINQVLRNEPFNLESDLTPTEMGRCKSWYTNPEFRVLIAACDMFWTKFPDSPLSQLRVCTLNSRYKDCSTISAIKHLSSVSNLPVGDIFKYIFSERVRDEILNIGKAGEEFSKEDSYFPYMRELRLSKKSPYSSSVNENLHNWIHMFCALMGSERSYNAKIISDGGLTVTMNLTLFAAFAFRRYTSPRLVFGDADDAETARNIENKETGAAAESGIDANSALGVYQNMLDNGNSVPPEIQQELLDVISKMPVPRDKTIGQFLRRNITVSRTD